MENATWAMSPDKDSNLFYIGDFSGQALFFKWNTQAYQKYLLDKDLGLSRIYPGILTNPHNRNGLKESLLVLQDRIQGQLFCDLNQPEKGNLRYAETMLSFLIEEIETSEAFASALTYDILFQETNLGYSLNKFLCHSEKPTLVYKIGSQKDLECFVRPKKQEYKSLQTSLLYRWDDLSLNQQHAWASGVASQLKSSLFMLEGFEAPKPLGFYKDGSFLFEYEVPNSFDVAMNQDLFEKFDLIAEGSDMPEEEEDDWDIVDEDWDMDDED